MSIQSKILIVRGRSYQLLYEGVYILKTMQKLNGAGHAWRWRTTHEDGVYVDRANAGRMRVF